MRYLLVLLLLSPSYLFAQSKLGNEWITGGGATYKI